MKKIEARTIEKEEKNTKYQRNSSKKWNKQLIFNLILMRVRIGLKKQRIMAKKLTDAE